MLITRIGTLVNYGWDKNSNTIKSGLKKVFDHFDANDHLFIDSGLEVTKNDLLRLKSANINYSFTRISRIEIVDTFGTSTIVCVSSDSYTVKCIITDYNATHLAGISFYINIINEHLDKIKTDWYRLI